jgi:murein L,D-transpeptidase YafK
MRWFNLVFSLFVVLGLAVLAYILIWMPPSDADAYALTRERATRHQAYNLGKPLVEGATSEALDARLQRTGFKLGQSLFLRIYKREFEVEVWMQRDGRYALFATYPICTFSGQLGPKMRNLDRQSPEGIYEVTAGQLNPHSRWHKSFNLGFPNAFDRANGRTGSYLMVHGGCSSIGCYAMTNPVVDDLFTLAKAAFAGGQQSFQVQALPFRMSPDALATRSTHVSAAFWSELKPIADAFDETRMPPDVVVCDGHYRLAQRTASRTGRAAPPPTGCKRIQG